MSILIKGAKMPENCNECPLCYDAYKRGGGLFCNVDARLDYSLDGYEARSPICPLVEVEEFEVWPNMNKSRKFNILKTKGGMHFMGPNGPVDPPKGADNDD